MYCKSNGPTVSLTSNINKLVAMTRPVLRHVSRWKCCRRGYIDLSQLRSSNKVIIQALAEVQQRSAFKQQLTRGQHRAPNLDQRLIKLSASGMTPYELESILRVGFITFLLHVEARIASSLGYGYYTIGPCGEELLSAIGMHLRDRDASALHYRHVGTSLMRAYKDGDYRKSVGDIILDRARGFTCSSMDPVTGGRHCAIGGTPFEYVVTSTLASQCTPAVGRAMGIALAQVLGAPSPFPVDGVSFVSLGEGSANNAHFLSAMNLAEYACYNHIKCPVVIAVSDNQLCISLRDKGWIDRLCSRYTMKLIVIDGSDAVDIYEGSRDAIHYSRSTRRPCLMLIKGLVRRFGHAATDRQSAYLSPVEIDEACETNHLLDACSLGCEAGIVSWTSLLRDFEQIQKAVEEAFQMAVNEPKLLARSQLADSNSAPLQPFVAVKAKPPSISSLHQHNSGGGESKESMRKLMTRVFDEALGGGTAAGDTVVYIGEDVRHGGYYLVTDGLAAKHRHRVIDFPPDETALLGSGWGLSQAGLTVIVEVPYAKYLDCAADIFNEIAITHWLSNGRERSGLVVRLQGFDKGTFGGNFHTHNMLSIPPGIDAVCYSNGWDYVRGMRYLLRQAGLGGRICMSIDCTDLLNRRHLLPESSDGWFLHRYPSAAGSDDYEGEMSFDEVVVYASNGGSLDGFRRLTPCEAEALVMDTVSLIIVSYGNGIPTSLVAMNEIQKRSKMEHREGTGPGVLVVDTPYLSSPPKGLIALLTAMSSKMEGQKLLPTAKAPSLLFADICKEGGSGMPLAGFVVELQSRELLAGFPVWQIVGAQATYNPLGQMVTFLSKDDIISKADRLSAIREGASPECR